MEERKTAGRVRAICISEKRGTEKHAVAEAKFEKGFGIVGDAHAGHWHRQVSLLSYDKVKEFNSRGADVQDGACGENLVVEDLDFRSFPVGTILRCQDVVLHPLPDLPSDGRVHHAGAGRICRSPFLRNHSDRKYDDRRIPGQRQAVYGGSDHDER